MAVGTRSVPLVFGLALSLLACALGCGGKSSHDDSELPHDGAPPEPPQVPATVPPGANPPATNPTATEPPGTDPPNTPPRPDPVAERDVCLGLIDDLEDETGRICEGDGRIGVWYAFNDGTGTQWPAPTAPGVPIESSALPNARGASRRAMHTYGDGAMKWHGGIGIDFAFDGEHYDTYAAGLYDGVRFWARADTPQRIRVRIGTALTTVAEYGGTCEFEPCGTHGMDFDIGTEFAEYRVPFNDLQQVSYRRFEADFLRGQLTNLQFMAVGPSFDFWIDDVSFYRERDCCNEPPAGCEGTVEMPDPALNARVRAVIGKPEGDLTCEDLCNATPLKASGGPTLLDPAPPKIRDLTGLQCMLGLRRLDLSVNDFEELGPLASLSRLTDLNVDASGVRDLSPLAHLTSLTSLWARGNQIEDLSPLVGLPALAGLFIDGNRISDPSPLASVSSLGTLNIGANRLVDVSPLATLPLLERLSVTANQLEDLSQVLAFPHLTYVDISANPEACTEAERAVVRELSARGIGVTYGSTLAACPMPAP
jgi:hypothetical protein